MKALIKIFVYAIVASMAFWGCDLSSNVSVSEEQNNAEIEPVEHTTVLFGGPEGCVREMEAIYLPIPPITNDLAEEPTTDEFTDEPQIYEPVITEMPIMDSKVVSYKRVKLGKNINLVNGFVTDEKILKQWFPHIFENGKANSECDYFAVYTSQSNYSYTIFSQDENFIRPYIIMPNDYNNECLEKADSEIERKLAELDLTGLTQEEAYKIVDEIKGGLSNINSHIIMEDHAALICGDKVGNLKSSVYIYGTLIYNDPSWNCKKEDVNSRNVFF